MLLFNCGVQMENNEQNGELKQPLNLVFNWAKILSKSLH